MAYLVNGGQPRSARAFVQGWHAAAAARALLLLGLTCVGGCANGRPSTIEDWWHDAIGGKVSEQRPPPPGDKAPYPNLATVPPKPPPADTAAWNRTTAQLENDRVAARQAAAVAPIPTASAAPPPSGGTSGVPAQDGGASAALVGASPPAPAASARAPKPAAASTPPDGTAPLPPFAPPLPPAMTSAEAARVVANGNLPALPTEAPPRSNVSPEPRPSPVPVTATPPVPAPAQAEGTGVDFDRDSARLNDPALASVRALAIARGGRAIAITGHGDATSSDPLDQEKAVTLGLARAQALATALVAQGVPYAMLRLNAESAGRGANVRLLQ